MIIHSRLHWDYAFILDIFLAIEQEYFDCSIIDKSAIVPGVI